VACSVVSSKKILVILFSKVIWKTIEINFIEALIEGKIKHTLPFLFHHEDGNGSSKVLI